MKLQGWLGRQVAAFSFATAAIFLLAGFDVDSTSRSVYRILSQETRPGGGVSLGSGFLVGGRRFVVTNNHVVDSKGPATVFIAYMLQGRNTLVRARIIKRVADKDRSSPCRGAHLATHSTEATPDKPARASFPERQLWEDGTTGSYRSGTAPGTIGIANR